MTRAVQYTMLTHVSLLLLNGAAAFTVVPQGSLLPKSALATRSSTSSSVVLHMNLFDRFSRVAKSNLNNILKNLEDPEKIMNQAVEDMQVRRRCSSYLT